MINAGKAVEKIISVDHMLEPFRDSIYKDMLDFCDCRSALIKKYKSLKKCISAFDTFGFNLTDNGWVFREWLPGADAVSLIGDFNSWNPDVHRLERRDGGVWEIDIPGRDSIKAGQHVKLKVYKDGNSFERIPAFIRQTEMDFSLGKLCGIIDDRFSSFDWDLSAEEELQKHPYSPIIYEAHVGMSQEFEGIGHYRDFAEYNLWRIRDLGYNTVQLMAIQEHPYYASFGYQVTNFYSPSSWFGKPEDLKYLINKAHQMGLRVMIDLVHSHACANLDEGLNYQDGTEDLYFGRGEAGYHPAWKTRLFDYSKPEVLSFLLSNVNYWLTEYHFDGIRFDGVTSMLYHNHGLEVNFMGYDQYYDRNVNYDAKNYLRLANLVAHSVKPGVITICEEMSGIPGGCLPVKDGGLGFDYRLAMGIPDFWIKTLKEKTFDSWDMFEVFHELTTCRPMEKSISYCESHDQALVGDKTLIFRMMDAEMYIGMDRAYHSITVDNAIDYLKLMRIYTALSANGGYLNFMGNEFGHPEWIDFPRDGNDWSYQYARRQWSLAYNGYLKYSWIEKFDRDMVSLLKTTNVLNSEKANPLFIDNEHKTVAFSRNGFIVILNLHPVTSQTEYFVSIEKKKHHFYQVIFSSDHSEYGGQGNVDRTYRYKPYQTAFGWGFTIYLPAKTAVVIAPVDPLTQK